MLCTFCQRIPIWFFTKTFGPDLEPMWQYKPENVVWHSPLQYMRFAAEAGCALCQVMSTHVDMSIVPVEYERAAILTLQRGPLNPNSSFGLYLGLGMDDLTIKYFYPVPDSWSKCLPPALPDTPDDQYAQIIQWLDECESQHSRCRRPVPSFLPTRLLDVSSSGSPELVVLKSKRDIPKESYYLALSHCWGPQSHRKYNTVANNIHQRYRYLSMLTLPQSFRDAIAITRKLGFKYLWIDSLCIIQDQREDWEVEVALMGDIFANAFCTLAAASSPSSFDGCRIRRDSTKRTRFTDATFGDKRVRIFERCPEDWNSEYMTNPLQKRAWVLQERLLSRRTVIFSTNMLLWECATAKASEQLPWLQMRVEDPPKILLLNDDNEMDAGNETFAQREAWFKTIESYTQMAIKQEQDRLPAIAGLITKAKHHGICVAGMWAQDMPSALLWHTESPSQCDEPNAAGPRRPTQKRAPSWSWAAVEGEISYASQGLDESAEPQPSPTSDYNAASFTFHNICTVLPIIPPSASAQLGASILISGLIQTGIVEKLRPSDACSPGHKLVTTNGLDIGIVLPDVTNELGYGTAVCCLPVRRDPYWAGAYIDTHELYGTSERNLLEKLNLIMGLVLQRIEGEDGTFHRCGLLRVAPKDRFEGCPKRRVIII